MFISYMQKRSTATHTNGHTFKMQYYRSKSQHALRHIQESAEVDENEIIMQTSEELLESLRLSRCMLIMR